MITARKIIGFSFFGVLAGGAYALVYYWVSSNSNLPVFLNTLISFTVAMPISYCGNRWFTYQSNNILKFESLRFISVQFGNLLLTSLIVHLTSEIFMITIEVQIFLAFISAPIVSFLLFELWVYRQSSEQSVL